jgi:sensor histidine kinase YesM
VDAVRGAPPWAKVSIWGSVAAIVLATAFGGWATTHPPGASGSWRLASVICANLGLLLLCLSALLHQITQRPDAWHLVWRLPLHVTTVRPHAVMLALPFMAFMAGCLLAASTALLLPTIAGSSTTYVIIGLFYTAFIAVAALTVRDTTAFLYRHAQEQARVAARARSDATEAQLSALRAQMNPHFLFNALNTVAALIRTDPRSAERTVENLAHVLRRTLDRSQRAMGTLQEELDYLEAYLSVEQERFGSRLGLDWAIEPETRDLPVPPMTLQPLVENAIKHGLSTKLAGGRITVRSRRADGNLLLEVADDGTGFPARYREGTGLSNLRERLDAMYGGAAQLTIARGAGGAQVRVVLPVTQVSLPGHVTQPDRERSSS